MEGILLVGSIQAFFLSIFLLTKKSKTTADYILVILLLLLGLPLFVYYLEYDRVLKIISLSHGRPSLLYFINMPLIMSFTPSVYLYIKANIKNKKKFWTKNWLHYLPILLFVVLTLLLVDFDIFSNENYRFFSNRKNLIFLIFSPAAIIMAIFS